MAERKYGELLNLEGIELPPGVSVPPSYLISEEVIDAVLAGTGISVSNHTVPQGIDIWDIPISDEAIQALVPELASLQEDSGGGPLILRSSGEGDARGVGVYRSEVFDVSLASLSRSLKSVLGSYFSEQGQIYREKLGLDAGFEMFVQPVAGLFAELVREDHGDSLENVQLFGVSISGNATVVPGGGGFVRLQHGFGSAVNKGYWPELSLSLDVPLETPLSHLMIDAESKTINPRDYLENTEVPVFAKGDGFPNWDRAWGLCGHFASDRAITYSWLQKTLGDLQACLPNSERAHYFEFAITPGEDQKSHVLHVLQVATLAEDSTEVELEGIDRQKVLVDATVRAGGNCSAFVKRIVSLIDPRHSGLYAFDKTAAAESGYILVYHAQSNPSSSELDVRRLKNAKAIVVLESMSYGHAYAPEQHLVGYAEVTQLPVMSIYRRNIQHQWQTLNGVHSEDKSDRIQGAIVREAPAGKLFGVTASNTLGLIHMVDEPKPYSGPLVGEAMLANPLDQGRGRTT